MQMTPSVVGERMSRRAEREALVERAEHLLPEARALVMAHLDLGMSAEEIAVLHRVTPRAMRRRLAMLKGRLADPCFGMLVKYGDKLPEEVGRVARGYWIEGR